MDPLRGKKKKHFKSKTSLQDFFYYILVQDKVTIQTFDYTGCISLIIKAEITALQTFILMRRLIAEKSRPFQRPCIYHVKQEKDAVAKSPMLVIHHVEKSTFTHTKTNFCLQ